MLIERGGQSLRAHGFRASSGSLTARLKSLANYNFVHIEEAEEIGEDEFRTLDDTLRTTKGSIKIIFTLNTPPKNHWILRRWFDLIPSEQKSFYTPKLKEGVKDVLYISGTWKENEPNLDRNTIERYQSYQFHNPAHYYQVIEGLSPEEVRGKIYSGWQQIEAIPDGARLMRFGVDWGWWPDPLALIALYYWNGGYVVDEVAFGTNIADEMLVASIRGVNGYETIPLVCGADEPKSIEVLKRFGLRAIPSVKGPGSVEFRIKATSAKKMFVTKRSTNVWEAYENYHWAEDKDGNPKGEPDHYFSDAMDAVSYAVADISPVQQYLVSPQKNYEKRTNIAL
jgi:phage terminase large subunit